MLKTPQRPKSLAVLTSGGDAAGMNPAVRAVVRAGIDAGLEVDQFSSTVPKGGPLGFGSHTIITEQRIHMSNGILKFGSRIEGLVAVIINSL